MDTAIGRTSDYITDRIREIGVTPAGNVALRVGRVDMPGWQQVAYVVLTPGDVEELIGLLQASFRTETAVRTFVSADGLVGITVDKDGTWLARREHRDDQWGEPQLAL